MKRINLLPEHLQEKRIGFLEQSIGAIAAQVAVGFLFLAVLHYILGSVQYTWERHQNKAIKQKLTKFEAQVSAEIEGERALTDQIDQFQRSSEVAQRQIRYLERFDKDQYPWADMLRSLNTLIPERVWLNGLHIDHKGCSAEGGTFNNKSVGDLIQQLNESPYFTKARFIKTEVEKTDAGEVVQFQLAFALAKPST